MQHYYQYLTILLILSLFLTLFLIDYSHNTNEDKYISDLTTNSTQQLKTVVAYSFLKRIENEHVEIDCPNLKKPQSRLVADNLQTSVNGVWTHVWNTSVYVYSAYPDHRVKSFIYIRFIAMLKDDWNHPLSCQFLSATSIKVIRASRTNIWSKTWRNPDRMMPVLYSCPTSKEFKTPEFKSVTLTANPCEISGFKYNFNSETPIKNNMNPLRLMVCVKPLNFAASEDIFDKLITWIEINTLFGVDEFDIYINSVSSKKVLKLLKWYRDVRKNVNVLTYVNPLTLTNVNNVTALWRKRKNELISYNDCFYRNLHRTNIIIPLDLDEVIVPKIHDNYKQLLENITNSQKYSSLSVKNAFFFHKTNTYNMFETIFRTNFSPPYRSGKSFINTSNTLTVFNHYSLQPLYPGVPKTYFLNQSLAQLNHYRQGCDVKLLPEDCSRILNSSPVFDDVILRFKDKFLERYNAINKQLKLANVL